MFNNRIWLNKLLHIQVMEYQAVISFNVLVLRCVGMTHVIMLSASSMTLYDCKFRRTNLYI